MLTIKSKFIEFKDRQGEYYTVDELTKLSKALVTCDMINFRGNISRGYTADLARKIIGKMTTAGTILVVNDVTLHLTNELLNQGYRKEDIYLAYGKWEKDANPSVRSIVYNIMKNYIKNNIEEDLNVIELKEIFDMKFDCIIANPPYGKIGANITYKLRGIMNDDAEYINLLPANDYKRNDSKNLFNYQSDMESIKDGFADASVTTHLAKIHKTKVNNMTISEFERSQYIDRQLDKYFEENSKRSHYAVDNSCGWITEAASPNISYTILFDHRCVPHKHFAYSKKTAEYHWNILKDITMIDMLTSAGKQALLERKLNKDCITFSSDLEKNNFAMFMYSDNGFRFYAKILSALNKDSTEVLSKWVPKVDWSRAWTVEEILADYGYTSDEINDVMEDLKNYKGMED